MKAKKRESRKASTAVSKGDGTRPEFWLYAIGMLVGLFVAFQVYRPALHGPFLFDDLYLPMNTVVANNPLSGWVSGVRPLLMFTYWANYRSSGAVTTPYHEWNVGFHFLNSALVYFIARKLLDLTGAPRWLALFAAGLFLLHPVQTESVAYIAGRSDSLSSMFFLGAYCLFLYRRSPAIGWPTALGVLLLFGAAMASKENTVVLPALLLLTDYFWNPGFSFGGIRRNWRLYAPMAAGGAIGAIGVLRVLTQSDSAGFAMKDLAWYEYLFTQFRVVFVYLRLFVFPAGQTVDYDFPISRSLSDHGAIAGLIAIVALIAGAVYFRRRYPLACFGLLVFLILLAPTSTVIPIQDPIAERRLYLPMIGLLMVLLEGFRRLPISKAALAVSLTAVLAIAAAASYRRNIVWSGSIPLWEDAAAKAPRKARVKFQLAHAYFTVNRCQEAEALYREVAQLQPPDYRLLVDWALAYDCLNKSGEAIQKLQQAVALEKNAHVYSQLAMVYAKAGKIEQAFQALDAGEKLDSTFDVIYVYRGQLFLSVNDLPAAERQIRRALAINPRNEQAIEALRQIRMHQRTPR